MAPRQTNEAHKARTATTSLPMDQSTWKAVSRSLALPPQQVRIVENILCGKQDKEIAETLGVSIPTVRTYLGRIFDRLGVHDRLSLVLHIFAKTQEFGRTNGFKNY